jgi:outer membrane protein TolC
MKKLLILICCLVPGWVMGQDSLNLKTCHSLAIENYPLIKQRVLLEKITTEKINSLKTTTLPQFNLNGQASYQSDVTEVSIDVPMIEIPGMDKDVYKVTLDINQVIWDGGLVRNQKELERIGLAADQQNLEAELYKIKDRVNQIYFSILSLQKNRMILESMLNDLSQRRHRLESGVKNGIVLESQLDVLQAEILKIEQQVSELDVNIQSGLEMLGEFTQQQYPVSQVLAIPSMGELTYDRENKRLEFQVMDLQTQKLDLSKKLSGAKYRPKIYGFAQAGYGRPGLNMLNNEFDSFWMLGAKFSWNLWNWQQLKKENKVLDLQKDVIATQKQTLDKNLVLSMENQFAQIKKYQTLLEKDKEIIELRSKVTKTAASQMENGVITSSDYITELNNETQARLNRESHWVLLVKAKTDYLTLKGIM